MATRTASAVDVLPMIETLQRGVNNRLSVSQGTNTFRPITSAAHSNTAASPDACFTDQHCTHWQVAEECTVLGSAFSLVSTFVQCHHARRAALSCFLSNRSERVSPCDSVLRMCVCVPVRG